MHHTKPARSSPHPPAAPRHLQRWLDERLQGMGFEARTFAPLAPLGGLPAAHQLHQAGVFGQAETAAPPAGAGSIISHVFAEWAQEAGSSMPVMATQWHTIPGSGGVWAPGNAGLLLQECHAAHAYCGHADEHAQAMIGARTRRSQQHALRPSPASACPLTPPPSGVPSTPQACTRSSAATWRGCPWWQAAARRVAACAALPPATRWRR